MPTPRADLAQLFEGQASKTVTINEIIATLEALTVGGVITRGTNTPPTTPSEGDTHIIGGSPTGAWLGQARKIAHYYNGTWRFYNPREGWNFFSIADSAYYYYNGSTWVAV